MRIKIVSKLNNYPLALVDFYTMLMDNLVTLSFELLLLRRILWILKRLP